MLRFLVDFSLNLVSFLCALVQFKTMLNRYMAFYSVIPAKAEILALLDPAGFPGESWCYQNRACITL